ncbi:MULTISPECIES: AraC family transcriptional regulator [Shouchella]|uniref:AraC family transcriptional regulator n=2 Tax=Shouchella TaxID=2893057 RepID=A0ABY7WDD6_9BACI|nr:MULTISPECIES: AraC family transcriptional regulator [Shouchella]MED4126634.1 AraC family transcriptional regulator [Shouchella miscanthi]WDF04665.1 AraC family transcriptional regulator [Shouchella hunanensis]
MREQGLKGSYGFRFQEHPYPFQVNLWNIGWEVVRSPTYSWNGQTRIDREKIVFQYTLSGHGALAYEDQTFTLGKGQAFFVSIPSDHHYFYPKEATTDWEFIYITLEGKEALSMHDHIVEKYGPILVIEKEAEPIRLLLRLLSETASGEITNSYIGSQRAYEFLMTLFHFLAVPPKKKLKEPITQAITYMKDHMSDQFDLATVAHHVGLSKYYFIKQFKRELNITPMHYVSILRIKKAAYLLSKTDLTVAEVAHQVGIDDANYFTKLFKKTVGVSASKFRKNEDVHLIDYIITEWE